MNLIFLIMKNTLRQLFRKKGSIIIYLILPIIGLAVPMAMFASSSGNIIRIGIVNHDSGTISQQLLEDIKLQERFRISIVDESQINKSITNGDLDCVLVIPASYSDNFLNGNIQQIEVVSVQGIAVTGWVDGYLKTFLSNLELLSKNTNGDIAVFNNLYSTYKQNATTVEVESVKDIATNFSITYLGLGLLIQFLLIGAGRTANLIIHEREEKTLSRIHCAPVKGYQFIMSNVIINIGLLLTQTLVTLVLLQKVLKVEIGVSLLELTAIMFPLLIAAVGMALMICSFAKNEGHMDTLMTIFITPTCLISGCFWDVELMPEFMQKISQFLPQRWALDGVKALMMGNKLADLSLNLVILFAFAAAFFAIAVFGFTRKQATA